MIYTLKTMQTNVNSILSLKNSNRTSQYMDCLKELVEFVTAKLDQKQIG
jgi:hypothetical protein